MSTALRNAPASPDARPVTTAFVRAALPAGTRVIADCAVLSDGQPRRISVADRTSFAIHLSGNVGYWVDFRSKNTARITFDGTVFRFENTAGDAWLTVEPVSETPKDSPCHGPAQPACCPDPLPLDVQRKRGAVARWQVDCDTCGARDLTLAQVHAAYGLACAL